MKKNGKIELMRFVFCLCILFYHCNTQMGENRFFYPTADSLTFFFRGYIGVEFFFIVSGFLMARSAFKKIRSGRVHSIGKTTFRYVEKKYLRIFPVHLTAFIALFALYVHHEHYRGMNLLRFTINTIPNLFMLNKSGMDITNINHVEWYLGSMFLAMLLLYPILLKKYSLFSRVIAPLTAVFILGNLTNFNGTVTGTEFSPIGSVCFFRAIAGLCLGIAAFEGSKYIDSLSLTPFGKHFLFAVEIFLYLVVLGYTVSNFPKTYDAIAALCITFAVMLSFSGNVTGAAALNNNVVYFLGKISLWVYLCQLFAFKAVMWYYVNHPLTHRVAAVIAITAVMTAVCGLGGMLFEKLASNIRNKALKTA